MSASDKTVEPLVLTHPPVKHRIASPAEVIALIAPLLRKLKESKP